MDFTMPHDDVVTLTRCCDIDAMLWHWHNVVTLAWCYDIDAHLLALCEGIHQWLVYSTQKWPVMQSCDVSMNRLVNKQLSCWWFEMPCHSFDVTVMKLGHTICYNIVWCYITFTLISTSHTQNIKSYFTLCDLIGVIISSHLSALCSVLSRILSTDTP